MPFARAHRFISTQPRIGSGSLAIGVEGCLFVIAGACCGGATGLSGAGFVVAGEDEAADINVKSVLDEQLVSTAAHSNVSAVRVCARISISFIRAHCAGNR
jgi:hypothetical protein